MTEDQHRFDLAIEKFDAANAQDPKAAELLYAQRMTAWLDRLYPTASPALRLACRAQHIRRWEIPRSSFPMDRAGYHRWRTSLYALHADTAEKILREVGYDEPTIERVRSLLMKKRLKADPETQALEDVACLVFLESYFADFAARHDDQKIIGILRKTWAKMSNTGQAAALTLNLPSEAQRLIKAALDPNSQ
jgi:hypothetical protein